MLVFLVSRKFHAGFGLVGVGYDHYKEGSVQCKALKAQYHVTTTTCDAAKKVACRRGPEWSVRLYQLMLSYSYLTGYHLSSGSSSGPGAMPHTCYGRYVTSMMFTVGANRLHIAASLGIFRYGHPQVCH